MNVLSLFLSLLVTINLGAQISFSDSNPPDYSNIHYWSAHPHKDSPAKLVPKDKINVRNDELDVDIFFIHPTTYTVKKPRSWNGELTNAYLNDLTDNRSIKYQASLFNQVGHIYAPRYRQAHIKAYGLAQGKNRERIFNLAYQDVKNAFDYYMKYYNDGKPFIIACHSQGSTHGKRLIKEIIDISSELRSKMVVAYLVGIDVKTDQFINIDPCESSDEVGCFVSWRTIRKNTEPPNYYPTGDEFVVTNPLTWNKELQYGDKELHKGAVLKKFNKVRYCLLNAQCQDGILYVTKPKIPFGFLFSMKNYHILDYNFFYYDVQANAIERSKAFLTDW